MNDKETSGKKARKAPLSERLRRALDIPAGTFGKCSYIGLSGRRELEISGCEGLESYGGEQVVLRLCDGLLTIDGSGLELTSFSGGIMIVSGRVERISLGDEKGPEDR